MLQHFQDTGIVKHFHVCGGVGSGAAGFNDANPSIPGGLQGKMVCIGGVDVDARACADFQMLTGVKQAQLDLFTVGMYQAFHGRLPPAGWRETTADDFRAAAHHHFPDIVFTSMPCKGFSGLLSASKSTTAKYVALNELTLRGMWLTMEAFADDPPGLLIFENVPRIATRGRHLLDQIISMMSHYGYVHAETTHDCGELGEGLAQSRRRYLVVFRHVAKVPPFLYEPTKRPLKAVGDVLGHMPLPGDPAGGPMHRVPALNWKTWVRLAFVEAGSDWRSLNKLAVEDGNLRDYLIVPEMYSGALGVRNWTDSTGAVTGESLPSNGAHAVADVRFSQSAKWKDGQAFGVLRWSEYSGTIPGQPGAGQGAYSVQDIRCPSTKHNNCFRIVQYEQAAGTVTAGTGPSAGGQGVADPRPNWDGRHGHLHVGRWRTSSRTVTAGGKGVQGGYLSVSDPRPNMQREKGDHYLTGGHYGVVRWGDYAGAVSASACHDNGNWSVADHRPPGETPEPFLGLPQQHDKLVCRIQALDGTWHRPFTTLELASLQSLIDPEEWFAPGGPGHAGQRFVMDGSSDQRWREGIGNAVPRKSAKAMGEVMGRTILLARSGETFLLGSTPIWVQPVAVALSVAQEGRTA